MHVFVSITHLLDTKSNDNVKHIRVKGHYMRYHDAVIKWKHFPRNWPFVRGIPRSPGNSPHKGQWRGALMFSLICVWINDWVNNREAGDLRCYCAHYDVIVICQVLLWSSQLAHRCVHVTDNEIITSTLRNYYGKTNVDHSGYAQITKDYICLCTRGSDRVPPFLLISMYIISCNEYFVTTVYTKPHFEISRLYYYLEFNYISAMSIS